ncbi:uncharacterized protein LOC132031762 [Lycium ferocissimum]|uniref:uncharacterized protein LOC132031762 n=1 Tax=Lycium ferocissimum TaxID=112874 RepID=UPI0028168553|nr:uncharacterized protein LOC132031762 [Lycium ferocissimum]
MERELSFGPNRITINFEDIFVNNVRNPLIVDEPYCPMPPCSSASSDLDELVGGIPPTEKLFVGGDFNGHIRPISGGYDDVHGDFGFGDRNGGGVALLDFARAFGLVIANSSFPKKEEHLVTFRSSLAKTQIDFLLLRKDDKGLRQRL